MASNFLEWLADTPFLIAFVMIALPAVVLAAIGILTVRALYPEEYRIMGTLAHAKINYMAEIYALLIGLLLVTAFEQYQSMQTTVTREALALRALYHVSEQLPEGSSGPLPRLIEKYTQDVIDEWPILKFGEESKQAQRDLDLIFGEVAAIGRKAPESTALGIQAEALAREVLNHRATRITSGPGQTDTLPRMLANVLLVMTVIAIALPWFAYTPYAIVHIMLGSALVLVFVSLIILAVKMLYPFAGEAALLPMDFTEALKTMAIAHPTGAAP